MTIKFYPKLNEFGDNYSNIHRINYSCSGDEGMSYEIYYPTEKGEHIDYCRRFEGMGRGGSLAGSGNIYKNGSGKPHHFGVKDVHRQ